MYYAGASHQRCRLSSPSDAAAAAADDDDD